MSYTFVLNNKSIAVVYIMLKGSIKTRDNILRKFKNLKVTVNNKKIRIDSFIEMTVEEDAGKANYTTDKNYYKYMAEDIVDITKDSIQPGESVIINLESVYLE